MKDKIRIADDIQLVIAINMLDDLAECETSMSGFLIKAIAAHCKANPHAGYLKMILLRRAIPPSCNVDLISQHIHQYEKRFFTKDIYAQS